LEKSKEKTFVQTGQPEITISTEEWQQGMEAFNRFLKTIDVKRVGRVVHVDWIFEFPTVELAKGFVKASQMQFGSLGAIISKEKKRGG